MNPATLRARSVARRRVGPGALALAAMLAQAAAVAAQGTYGAVDDPCLSISGTPSAGSAAVAGATMGTPVVDEAVGTPADPASIDVGLLYLDLMVPHQAAIAAVGRAAATRTTDPRLQEIAADLVAARDGEAAELRGLRDRLFPGAAPVPIDTVTLTALDRAAPGASIAAAQSVVDLDVAGMLSAICGADDPDRVFIDLAIPHHRATIELSRAGAAAGDADVRALAERIARDREAEIAALAGIREDLFGSATPQPVAPGA
jgi:uncharacterized protein (DUF305 family)